MNSPRKPLHPASPGKSQSPRSGQQKPVKPGIVQTKGSPAQPRAKHPSAPAVYRPQPVPKVLQTKTGVGQTPRLNQPRQPPAAPPAYRPQPVPKVLQGKLQASAPPAVQTRRAPVAPPVYNPQPTPKVLQLKKAGAQPSQAGQESLRGATLPMRQRSEGNRVVQPRMAEVKQALARSSQAATGGVSAPSSPGNKIPYQQHRAQVIQREVAWEAGFHEDEPDDVNDLTLWMDAQNARDAYTKADKAMDGSIGSLLTVFDKEPNLLLAISTDPNMVAKHLGETSLEFGPPGQMVGVGSSNTDKWVALAKAGAKATITVAISTYNVTAAKIAHTLNHELSLHAMEFLKFVRAVRQNPNQDVPALAEQMLSHYHAHHVNIKDEDNRANLTFEKMKEQSNSEDWKLELIDAYFDDYEMYDDQGHYKEQRSGHSDTQQWQLPLSQTSPVYAMKIGETKTFFHNKNRIRIERATDVNFKLWFAANQAKPYNVKVTGNI